MKPIRTARRIKRVIISVAVISVFAGGLHVQKPAIQNYTADRVYDSVCEKLLNSENINNRYIADIMKKINDNDKNKIFNIISKYVEFKNIPDIVKYVHSETDYNDMLKILKKDDKDKINKILQKYFKDIPAASKKK